MSYDTPTEAVPSHHASIVTGESTIILCEKDIVPTDQLLVVDSYQSTSEDGSIGQLNLLVDGEALVQSPSQRLPEKVYQIYQFIKYQS